MTCFIITWRIHLIFYHQLNVISCPSHLGYLILWAYFSRWSQEQRYYNRSCGDKLNWDELVPMNVCTSWNRFKQNLGELDKISIPWYICLSVQVHGLADASSGACGFCIDVRTTVGRSHSSRLLTALKRKSIARLELCAAHILAKLWSYVAPLLNNFELESMIPWQKDNQMCLLSLLKDVYLLVKLK